jgi:hypothetical protein
MTEHSPAAAADDDDAHLRFVTFGTLPARVLPDEYVELLETSPAPGRPEPAGSEAQNEALHSGG